MKTCKTCHAEKDESEFYASPKMPGGLDSTCKSCRLDRVKSRRLDPEEGIRIRAIDKKRGEKPERRAKKVEYTRDHRENNPEKHKARTAVGNAVRDGRLKRLPCKFCGEPEVQAHHADYSKPLEVEWVCCWCHHHEVHGSKQA